MMERDLMELIDRILMERDLMELFDKEIWIYLDCVRKLK